MSACALFPYQIKLSVLLSVIDSVYGSTIVGQDMLRLKKRIEALAVGECLRFS
jgi:hypothetical protein